MVEELPPAIALLIGAVIGALLHGPVKRWFQTLVRTVRERASNPDGVRAGSSTLLVIFATLHPAPWLILIGLPFCLYRLWSDPLRMTWGCLLAGCILGALLAVALDAFVHTRIRPTHE